MVRNGAHFPPPSVQCLSVRYDTHAHIRRRLTLDWFTCRIGDDDPSVAKEVDLQQVFGLFFAVLERPVQHAVPRRTFVDIEGKGRDIHSVQTVQRGC